MPGNLRRVAASFWPQCSTRLEQDERDLARGALAVGRPVAVVPGGGRPEALALAGARLARADLQPPAADLDLGVGVRAQVVQPARMLRVAALRGDDEEVVAVRHVDERRAPALAGLGPDVLEHEHRRDAGQAAADA